MRRWLARFFWVPTFVGMTIPTILVGHLQAQPWPDTVTITSGMLPYTLPLNFCHYRIAPSVGQGLRINSATNGIIVNNRHDIEIFGQYLGTVPEGIARLNFCSEGGDAYYGISLANCYNVTIKDLEVIAGSGTLNDYNDSGNTCVRETGSSHDVTFRNVKFSPDGLDGRGFKQTVDAARNSYNFRFTHCLGHQYSNTFTRRDIYGAALLRFEFSAIIDTPDFHVQIDSCNFSRSIHVAIALTGSQVAQDSGALAYIFDNIIHMRGRNDLYTTFTDAVLQSLADNFAIDVIGARRGTRIYRNTIYADDVNLHYGGSGILLQGCAGWPSDPVQVYENQMILSSGRHIAVSQLKQVGMGAYIRALDKVLANRNLWFYDNDIQIYVDTSQQTTSVGRAAEGIRVLVDSLDKNIIIANNHVQISRIDSANGMGNGTGESELITSAITIAQQLEVPNDEVAIYGNFFGDIKNPVRLGCNRETSFGGNNVFLFADTLYSKLDRDTTFWFEKIGTDVIRSIRNIHQDCVFLGGADPGDIVFVPTMSTPDSLGKSLEQWKTVEILCVDLDTVPIAGASVYYADAHNEGFFATSDLNGWARKAVKIRYDHQDYIVDSYNPGDSTFNPFVFTGVTSDLADTATGGLTVSATVYKDTLFFDTAIGEPAPVGTRILIVRRSVGEESAFNGPPVE